VFSATLAVATLACFIQAQERQQVRWYLLFGVCSGFGLLSKYNYVFWLLGLLAAALSLPELRPTMRDKRMWIALAICVLIFLPNGLWILQHHELAFLTVSKFGLQESRRWVDTIGIGTTKLLVAIASFLGLLLLVYLLVFSWNGYSRQTSPQVLASIPTHSSFTARGSIYQLLLWRTLFVIAGILAVAVLGFQATDLRERWLQPILICAPVLAVAVVSARMDSKHFRRLAWLAGAVMLSVTAIMPGRIILAERLKREEPLNHPYDELARKMKMSVQESALIVTDTRLLAGNLRLAFPKRLFVTPELVDLFAPRAAERSKVLLVWDATHGDDPPKPLRAWAEKVAPSLQLTRPKYLTATYKYFHERTRRLGMLSVQTP
jgi:hypothetical protein